MGVMQFSTRGLPPEMRREVAHAAYGAHVNGAVDFTGEEPLSAAMVLRDVADVHVARVETSPMRITTGADDTGILYISFTTAGGGVIDARGEGREVRAGDINVLRRERRCVTVAAEASTLVNIAVPRARLMPKLESADCLTATRSMQGPAAKLLRSYAQSLLSLENDLSTEEAELAASHLVDLAALMLGPKREAAELAKQNGVRAARRRAIHADIAANLAEPHLSLNWIAARHGLSAAYVRTLFYHEGTNFTDFVLAARLDLVCRMLRDPAQGGRTIAALALMAGFGDISWFNQAFRRRFSMTPSDMRALLGPDTGGK